MLCMQALFHLHAGRGWMMVMMTWSLMVHSDLEVDFEAAEGGGGSFRDVSPSYGPRRGGRSLGRGYNALGGHFHPLKGNMFIEMILIYLLEKKVTESARTPWEEANLTGQSGGMLSITLLSMVE